MGITCRCCGKKLYQQKGRRDKVTCSVLCRVTLHRIKKRGFEVCNVTRSKNDLEKEFEKSFLKIYRELQIDEPTFRKEVHIHHVENGDAFSKHCYYIFLRGTSLKKYRDLYGIQKIW